MTRVLADLGLITRDGVRLEGDAYLPEGAGPWPLILERTPYGRREANHADRSRGHAAPLAKPEVAARYVAAGWAVFLQDTRGRYGSGGDFTKYVGEAEDGVDTLTWLRAQRWCDGRVAAIGFSYGAHAAAALGALAEPPLAAMILDSGGFASAYDSGVRQGGAFELKQLTWAVKHARLSAPDAATRAELDRQDIRDWVGVNPWLPGHSPVSAMPDYEAYVLEQWRNERFGPYWRQPGLYARGHWPALASAPSLWMSSWYDPYAMSAVENFTGVVAAGACAARLVMGPWTHGQRSVTHAGDVDFGPAATLDGQLADDPIAFRLDFLGAALRDDARQPKVDLFVMGGGSGGRTPEGRLDHGGRWLTADAWPPRDTRATEFFLQADGGIGAEGGEQGMRRFHADPADPVPTIGGALASGAPVMYAGGYDQREGNAAIPTAHPDRSLADRPDVLVWRTTPLPRDLEVVGPVEARLWVATDGPDADVVVRLLDEHPPSADWPMGFALNLSHGILRLRLRDRFEEPRPMVPGEIVEVTVRLFPTANRFKSGHRLRVDVCGSSFPHFDVNPNSGAPAGEPTTPRIAQNVVFCGPGKSRLVLAVRPA